MSKLTLLCWQQHCSTNNGVCALKTNVDAYAISMHDCLLKSFDVNTFAHSAEEVTTENLLVEHFTYIPLTYVVAVGI